MLRSKLLALVPCSAVRTVYNVPKFDPGRKGKKDELNPRSPSIKPIKVWKEDLKKEKERKLALEKLAAEAKDISEVAGEERKLHWHDYNRNRLGHGPHGPWLYTLPRRQCFRYGQWSGSPCPCCRAKWLPNYKDVEILKDYVNPITMQVLPQSLTEVCSVKQRMLKEAVLKSQSHGLMKPPPNKIQAGWTDKDVYGKHSSQLYGASQVYHKAYRHLPGNIYYEKENEYWGHHKVTTESTSSDFIDYE